MTRSLRSPLLACAIVAALATGAAAPGQDTGASPPPPRADARIQQLVVDMASDTGPFHGGASGTLYGLYDARLPFPNLIEGIGLRTVSTKAQDGPQHPGADALEVAPSLADASGGDTYIYMTDIHRNFPYHWKTGDCATSVAAYLGKLEAQVQQVKALPPRYRRHIVLVPFNEPEGNMFGTGPQSCNGSSWLKEPAAFFDAWDRAYRLIKGMLPDARIAGPNTSILFDQVHGFLVHAVAAGTVPDVMTWHELSNPATVRASVTRYRQWEKAVFANTRYAGRQLPININEYAYNYHTSVPGQMIQWIAAIEDAKVDADIAYWNIDGNLSDSAVEANRGNGQWWLLNAYASMSGHTLAVTPPEPGNSYTLQGIATLDPTKRQARVLLGGGQGRASVSLVDMPASLFGATARVLVREIGWSGQLGDSGPPRTVADLTLPIVRGRVTLTFGSGGLPALRDENAYELIVSPGARGGTAAADPVIWRQDYEAEAATRRGTGLTIVGPEGSPKALDRFYTSGGYAVAGFATGRDAALDFAVEVPRRGTYDLRVLASSFNRAPAVAAEGPTNVYVSVDGKAAGEAELLLPLGYKPSVWDHADLKLPLTPGRHVLSIATRSLDGTRRTAGDARIDRITLSLPAGGANETIYEAEYAALAGAAPAYGAAGASGPGAVALKPGATATFWVYAPRDGTASVLPDLIGRGRVALTVNGTPLPAHAAPFLLGGVNKIVATAIGGPVILDRLRVAPMAAHGTSYEAEMATLAGTARVEAASRASGGRAVTAIGGDPGNGNTLTFADVVVPRAGRYALTVRYANAEQSQATHYNPDPLARRALLSVNGAAPVPVTFPNSFHRNTWWELSVPVTLRAGRNVLRFAGEEQRQFDGQTYASAAWPGVLLRSRFAPDIDRITVTPLATQVGPALTKRRTAR